MVQDASINVTTSMSLFIPSGGKFTGKFNFGVVMGGRGGGGGLAIGRHPHGNKLRGFIGGLMVLVYSRIGFTIINVIKVGH